MKITRKMNLTTVRCVMISSVWRIAEPESLKFLCDKDDNIVEFENKEECIECCKDLGLNPDNYVWEIPVSDDGSCYGEA